MTASSDVTHILAELARGHADAASELLPLVYDELRQLAAWPNRDATFLEADHGK